MESFVTKYWTVLELANTRQTLPIQKRVKITNADTIAKPIVYSPDIFAAF